MAGLGKVILHKLGESMREDQPGPVIRRTAEGSLRRHKCPTEENRSLDS